MVQVEAEPDNQRRHAVKRCPSCGRDKEVNKFYGTSEETLSDYCKSCWSDIRKTYHQKNQSIRISKRTETTKFCKKCGVFHDLSEFYVSKGRYSGYCRLAQNLYKKELRDKNRPLKPYSENKVESKKREVLPEGQRRCSKCENILPVTKFYKRGPNTDLYTSRCRSCHNKASKESKSNEEV